MKLLILALLLGSCKGWDEWADAEDTTFSGPYNIQNNWNGTYEDPVLQNVPLNQSVPAYNYLSCQGSFATSNSSATVEQGMMIINAANANQGTISFGALAYDNSFEVNGNGDSNPNCESFSGQVLDYTVDDASLTVCLRDPNLGTCFTYSKVN